MLFFVTSNTGKFNYAVQQLDAYGIQLEQKSLDVMEIQSESVEDIAQHKAASAYEILQAPLLVNDAHWNIPALNGFPGPYMAYVDRWFSPDDFLRLMTDVDDRRVILTEVVVYHDHYQSKVFTGSVAGVILEAASGQSQRHSFDPVVSFRSDKKSLSQAHSEALPTMQNGLLMWRDFAAWYSSADFTHAGTARQ